MLVFGKDAFTHPHQGVTGNHTSILLYEALVVNEVIAGRALRTRVPPDQRRPNRSHEDGAAERTRQKYPPPAIVQRRPLGLSYSDRFGRRFQRTFQHHPFQYGPA